MRSSTLVTESCFELQLHLRQAKQTGRLAGLELHEDVDVTHGTEVVTKDRPVESEPADAVPGDEAREHRIVDG